MRKIKVLATKEIQELHDIDAKQMVCLNLAVYADGAGIPSAVEKIKQTIAFNKKVKEDEIIKAEELASVEEVDQNVVTDPDVIRKPLRKKAKQTNNEGEQHD